MRARWRSAWRSELGQTINFLLHTGQYCYHAIYESAADRPSKGSSRRWIDRRNRGLGKAEPLPPCAHPYTYRLFFFGASDACFVRYDNERGKGDHRHTVGVETSYEFTDLDTLLADFERDVTDWRDEQ